MLQKVIYEYYLLIGISVLMFLSACEEQVDYRVRAEWVYINKTTQPVAFSVQGVDTVVSPTETFTLSTDTEGSENVTEESYGSPFDGNIVRYGSDQCVTYGEDEGPLATKNYESKNLAERYYEFTYEFTEEEISKAEDCE